MLCTLLLFYPTARYNLLNFSQNPKGLECNLLTVIILVVSLTPRGNEQKGKDAGVNQGARDMSCDAQLLPRHEPSKKYIVM